MMQAKFWRYGHILTYFHPFLLILEFWQRWAYLSQEKLARLFVNQVVRCEFDSSLLLLLMSDNWM